jgi:hypothetical protein
MAICSFPERVEHGADTETQEAEEDIDSPVTFHHVRTASVILPSGDRVRRQVSLMSVHDESPFDGDESSPLIDSGDTPGTTYSSVAANLVDRGIQPCETSRLDKFKTWLTSERVKRCNLDCFLLTLG